MTAYDDDLTGALSGLKPFQQRTVKRVVERMFAPKDPQMRFLVADEVGLGKTKIAKALVVETIRRGRESRRRRPINIVYICSNHQIARQNVRDLAVLPGMSVNPVDRITMLPAEMSGLKGREVNLIAFTPGTSFRLKSAGGRVGERAMLLHILEQPGVFGRRIRDRPRAFEMMQLGAKASFKGELGWARRHVTIPPEVARGYLAILEKKRLDVALFAALDGRRARSESIEYRLIGELRHALAEACVGMLKPDLIILDEFQRFTSLLEGKKEDGQLASALFAQKNARVLLLSATPYRMLSRAEDDESHFEGFSTTIGFLLGQNHASELGVLRDALRDLRRGIVTGRSPEDLAAARDRAQDVLGRVMSRTERLAANDRSGMLRDARDATCTVTPPDVEGFIGIDRVVRTLRDVPGMVEYWKSAPYLFNFMDDYKVRREIDRRIDTDDGTIRRSLSGSHALEWSRLDRYRPVDPANGRLRWLHEDLARHHAFDLLWMPPSLPQTTLAGAYAKADGFTKRLVFSGWTVVPRVVAALTSYERERRHHRQGATNHSLRESFSGRFSEPRLANLALLLPCAALAEIGDPVRTARELKLSLPIDRDLLLRRATAEIKSRLREHIEAAPRTGNASHKWYVGAQFLLDPELINLPSAAFHGDKANAGFDDQWRNVVAIFAAGPETWGRPPEDLPDVLAEIAVGGPGAAFLRPLTRLHAALGSGPEDVSPREAAARLAWSFRSLVNSSEADQIIAASTRTGRDFWRALLKYCINGGLGSVLDEWLHLVPDQLRLDNTSTPLRAVTASSSSVLRLEDGRVSVKTFAPGDGKDPHHLRTNFAMRFGQATGVTAEGDNPVQVRAAFNSPFHPFVLVSTSVGQEGLDFHHYAHAIVHWNLPGNPVDLEQREGRVHRYKNHAVRKNVAADFREDPRLVGSEDVWSQLFRLASEKEDDLRPWWIYPGPAAIERLVPMLPMSREVGRLDELIEATTLYRMTMGQPRQAELISLLAGLSPEEQEVVRRAVTINLTPDGGA